MKNKQMDQQTNKLIESMNKKLNYWCFIILAFCFGFFGLQEFYRRETGLGVLAVLFCWTFIPAIVATIEGLVWLFKGPEEFEKKYNYEA